VSPTSPWAVLGIEPTRDVTVIRRAYAAALRRTNPDDDPIGFATLRQAYELVLARARASGGTSAPALLGAPAALASQAIPPLAPAAPELQAAPTLAPLAAPNSPTDAALSSPAAPGPAVPDSRAARTPVSPAAAVAPNSLADAPSSHETPDIDQLRAAFLVLQHAVTAPEAPSPEALHELLEACLRAPALENLGVRLEFESAMVDFLSQTLPRNQHLLDTVIERWRWRERRRLSASAGINALVAHADNLRRLEDLRVSAPRVYGALTRSPRAWGFWPQILVFRLDAAVRSELEEFQGTAPSGIDPRALAWWTTFFRAPRLRPSLWRLPLFLAFMAMLVTSLDPRARNGGFLVGGLLAGGAGMAVAVLWLLLVDWPRHFLTEARRGTQLGVRLGWAPACMVACLVAALLPDNWVAITAALAVTLALVLWSVAMAPDLTELGSTSLSRRAWGAVITNVPLAAWWLLLNTETPMPPTGAMSIVLAGTLVAVAFGQPLLWAEFQHGFSVGMRQRAHLSLGMAALFLAGLLYATPIASGGSHLLLMGLVILVIAQRTAAVNLNRMQVMIRHCLTVPSALVLAAHVAREDAASILQLGGMFFMLGVALSMGACFYSDRKASREESASPA
jgi:hypothetical protein